jgi:hypothetical protein
MQTQCRPLAWWTWPDMLAGRLWAGTAVGIPAGRLDLCMVWQEHFKLKVHMMSHGAAQPAATGFGQDLVPLY